MNGFKTYHPIVNFTYFAFVIAFAVIFTHPLCLAISLTCGIICSVIIAGRRAVKFNIFCMLPMIIFAALINPAFNHEGVTVILYLPSGNAMTLESVVYGAAAAALTASVLCWCLCCNEVMTSDKFIYLFGRVIPSLSLVLSVSLRLVPKFTERLKEISAAQKCIGRDVSSGGAARRARNGLSIMSILITWSLENAVETADSMKSRGFGLGGRTAYSVFEFDRRDMCALLCTAALGIYIIIGKITGGMYFRYFPSLKGAAPSFYSLSVFAAYFILCMIPVIIHILEVIKWKSIQSKI